MASRRGRSPTPRSHYRSRSPASRHTGSHNYNDSKRSRSRSRSPDTGRYDRRSRSRSWSRDRRSVSVSGNRVADARSRSRSHSRSRGRSRSRSDSRGRSRTRSSSPLQGCTKIVVEKLTKSINADHLYEVFGQYGQIRDLHLPMSRQFPGSNRGTAYILYVNESDAETAIANMHEGVIDGSTINVSIVFQRRKFSPAPPMASRGANIDPRLPAPGLGSGPRARDPRGGVGVGRNGDVPEDGGIGSGGRRRGRRGRRRDRDWNGSNSYRPAQSTSYSSPPRRGRSPSYDSRSRSPRREGARARGGRNGGYGDYEQRRSPSYDGYRTRSRSRSWGRGNRR